MKNLPGDSVRQADGSTWRIGPLYAGRVGVQVARYLGRGGGWLRFLPRLDGTGEYVSWYKTKREAFSPFAPG